GEGLRGRDHLALLEQEAHDVGGGPVQLGAELLGRGAPLDDHLARRHRSAGRRVGGQVHRLEVLGAATPPAPPPLWWATSATTAGGAAGTAEGGRTTGAPARTATAGTGRATGTASGTAGATGTATGTARAAATGGRGARARRRGD